MNKALSIFLCFAVWHMGIILQQRRYQQLLLKVLLCFHGFARKESHSFPLVSWTDFTVFPSIISISGKLKRLAMQLGFPKRDRGGYGVHIFVSSKLAIRLADFLQILVNSTGCAKKNNYFYFDPGWVDLIWGVSPLFIWSWTAQGVWPRHSPKNGDSPAFLVRRFASTLDRKAKTAGSKMTPPQSSPHILSWIFTSGLNTFKASAPCFW